MVAIKQSVASKLQSMYPKEYHECLEGLTEANYCCTTSTMLIVVFALQSYKLQTYAGWALVNTVNPEATAVVGDVSGGFCC